MTQKCNRLKQVGNLHKTIYTKNIFHYFIESIGYRLELYFCEKPVWNKNKATKTVNEILIWFAWLSTTKIRESFKVGKFSPIFRFWKNRKVGKLEKKFSSKSDFIGNFFLFSEIGIFFSRNRKGFGNVGDAEENPENTGDLADFFHTREV